MRALAGLAAVVVAACGGPVGGAPDAGPGRPEGGARDVADVAPASEVGGFPEVPCAAHGMVTPIAPDADAGVGPCAFALAPPPSPYLGHGVIEVFVGDVLVAQDSSRTNGWDFLTPAPDYSSFELFGPACDLLTAAGADSGTDSGTIGLTVVFPCLI